METEHPRNVDDESRFERRITHVMMVCDVHDDVNTMMSYMYTTYIFVRSHRSMTTTTTSVRVRSSIASTSSSSAHQRFGCRIELSTLRLCASGQRGVCVIVVTMLCFAAAVMLRHRWTPTRMVPRIQIRVQTIESHTDGRSLIVYFGSRIMECCVL